MNIYYTAKDIEDLAAKGVKQLEVSSHVIITDFARETAELFDIELIQPGAQTQQNRPAAPAASATQPAPQNVSQGRFNKPSGCQHGPISNTHPSPANTIARPAISQGADRASSPVNALVDIMGKLLKRGD